MICKFLYMCAPLVPIAIVIHTFYFFKKRLSAKSELRIWRYILLSSRSIGMESILLEKTANHFQSKQFSVFGSSISYKWNLKFSINSIMIYAVNSITSQHIQSINKGCNTKAKKSTDFRSQSFECLIQSWMQCAMTIINQNR